MLEYHKLTQCAQWKGSRWDCCTLESKYHSWSNTSILRVIILPSIRCGMSLRLLSLHKVKIWAYSKVLKKFTVPWDPGVCPDCHLYKKSTCLITWLKESCTGFFSHCSTIVFVHWEDKLHCARHTCSWWHIMNSSYDLVMSTTSCTCYAIYARKDLDTSSLNFWYTWNLTSLSTEKFAPCVGQESKIQSSRYMDVMAKVIMQFCKLGFVLTMDFLHLLSNRWLSELLVHLDLRMHLLRLYFKGEVLCIRSKLSLFVACSVYLKALKRVCVLQW